MWKKYFKKFLKAKTCVGMQRCRLVHVFGTHENGN